MGTHDDADDPSRTVFGVRVVVTPQVHGVWDETVSVTSSSASVLMTPSVLCLESKSIDDNTLYLGSLLMTSNGSVARVRDY